MRQAGTLVAKQDAERFASYLLTLGITSKVEPAADAWAVWIHDENQLGRSRQELAQFESDSADPRYAAAQQEAEVLRKETALRNRKAQKNYVDMRNEWANPMRRRRVTVGLIAMSVLAYFRMFDFPIENLMFSSDEIREGELWRLVTPIFVHGDTLHLLFNMYMLWQLGSMVEWSLGWLRYAALVLVLAVVSNLAQFAWAGPNFVGMSGVVYGLFGYAWIRSQLDPTCGLYVSSDLVFMMIAWFFLCMTPLIHGVANAAHAGGLVAGGVLGWLSDMFKHWRKT